MPSVTLRVADAMRQTGYLPEESKALGKAVKAKLVALLATQSTPFEREPIPVPSVNVNIWLSAPDFEKSGVLAGTSGMSEGGVLTALLLKDFEAWKASSMEPSRTETLTFREAKKRTLHEALTSRGQTMRHEQRRMLAAMDRLVEDPSTESRVMFLEAGTGIGKTLGYLGQALDLLADRPDAFVAVAVPSFALLRQVRTELSAFPSPPDALFLAGQNEWISESALQGFLLENSHRLPDDMPTRLTDWITQQAEQPSGGVSPLQAPPWSRESLLSAVPAFAFIDDVTVLNKDSDDDPGYRAYKQQFVQLGKARLAIMTHAMLATLLKQRIIQHYKAARGENKDGLDEVIHDWEVKNKGLPYREREQQLYEAIHTVVEDVDLPDGMHLIPNIDLLVIDEAHQFEDAVSNVFSTYISLRNLVRDARELVDRYPRVFRANALAEIMDIESLARQRGKQADEDAVEEMDIADRQGLFARLSHAMDDFLKTSKNAGKAARAEAMGTAKARYLHGVAQSMRFLLVLSERLGSTAGAAAYLHWSPQRDYPRLTMGRISLDREFHYLWSVLAHRTTLVSGTLYESIPSLSIETARRGLAVPPAFVMTMEPIHADWQIKPVTLFLVGEGITPEGRERFVRPLSRLNEKTRTPLHAKWLDDVASYTVMAHSTAAGGVLVLGTAFKDLDGLSSRLREAGLDPLVQRPGVDLTGLKMEFIAQKKQGGKPILLAAGAAWTGFDLHDPCDPNLLTDLVVLNAPLGIITRTVSRLKRASQKSTGHYEVAYNAGKMVRQAFGRLIRTELPPEYHNRRIHWLDARIHAPAMSGMMSPIRRFIARYKCVDASA